MEDYVTAKYIEGSMIHRVSKESRREPQRD